MRPVGEKGNKNPRNMVPQLKLNQKTLKNEYSIASGEDSGKNALKGRKAATATAVAMMMT